MDLSPNEIRFLRKLAKQGGKEVRPFALADETESDWEAFPSLKDRGLVRGYSTKDGIAACLSENGKEVLVQATPFRRMRAWVAARVGLFVDQILTHGAAMMLGALAGWFAKVYVG